MSNDLCHVESQILAPTIQRLHDLSGMIPAHATKAAGSCELPAAFVQTFRVLPGMCGLASEALVALPTFTWGECPRAVRSQGGGTYLDCR